MVCESMAEDRSEGSISNTIKNDQFMSLDDYAPKARKPYTITKQRERWTDEEHKKFLEALKLYGRAWRKIEEHVGTKTAVQIRSHAQKFFSKVVRESTEVKPIEIPPPRPKRKPMHPYPRKLSVPIKMGGDNMRSSSPNSSGSDQENQSPTSVLSAGGSNTFVLGDSCSPNGGSSGSEPDHSPDENVSSPPVQEGDSSDPMNLESCVEEKGFANEGSPESGSTQSLKLFGKTVIITDTHTPSSPNSLPQNFIHVSSLPCGAPLYYMQFLDENSNSSITFDGGFPYPFVQSSNPIIPKNQNVLETENEGSLTRSNTCSNTGSLSLGVSEIESGEQKKQKKPFLLIASERSAFTKQERSGSNDEKKKDMCRKGFVPYKRCLAQRDTHSTGGEEREEQRIRLCL